MNEPAAPTAGFSLFDQEERVVSESTAMVEKLEDVAEWVKSLAEAYQKGFKEEKRLVRLSDRMQLDLQRANHRLAEQADELSRLNRSLSEEIERRNALEAELKKMASTDSLTGAASRRALFELLDHELSRCRRSGEPLTVLLLDLDHFKAVNDTFGHAAGDAALVGFVSSCRPELRDSDVLGRVGGEEFIAVFPGAGYPHSLVVAERIRLAVEETRIAHSAGAFAITVSGGLAEAADDEGIDQLLRRADEALYEAKRNGRNRIEPSAGPGREGAAS